MKLWQWAIVGIVILFVLGGGSLTLGLSRLGMNNIGQTNTSVTQTISGNNLISVTDPIKFGAIDALAGGTSGVASGTINVFNTQGVKIDSCTLSSATCTSVSSYSSGQQIVVEIVTTNYVSEYMSMTVPYLPAGNTYTTIPMTIAEVKLGTMSVKLVDSAGNSYTSNASRPSGGGSTGTAAHQSSLGVYNFTTSATSTVQFTLTGYNTVANTGWASTADPTNNGLMQNVVLDIKNSNGTLSTSNLPGRFTIGTAYHWALTVNDGYNVANSQLATSYVTPSSVGTGIWSTQTIGSNAASGGSWSYTFTVNKGTLTAGQCDPITYQFNDYSNAAYYQANGNLGPSTATLGSLFSTDVCA